MTDIQRHPQAVSIHGYSWTSKHYTSLSVVRKTGNKIFSDLGPKSNPYQNDLTPNRPVRAVRVPIEVLRLSDAGSTTSIMQMVSEGAAHHYKCRLKFRARMVGGRDAPT